MAGCKRAFGGAVEEDEDAESEVCEKRLLGWRELLFDNWLRHRLSAAAVTAGNVEVRPLTWDDVECADAGRKDEEDAALASCRCLPTI